MSDTQLFRTAAELSSRAAPLEKALQTLIDSEMETLLGAAVTLARWAIGAPAT
jgi:hypothetical protein